MASWTGRRESVYTLHTFVLDEEGRNTDFVRVLLFSFHQTKWKILSFPFFLFFLPSGEEKDAGGGIFLVARHQPFQQNMSVIFPLTSARRRLVVFVSDLI